MAAKLQPYNKTGRKLLNVTFISAFWIIVFVTKQAEATTTQPPVTTQPATTVAPLTTQAPTTTTTLPPTTTIVPNQDRTTIGETVIGQCLCDLTGNECDPNCCCDKDCTPDDVSAFVCDPTSVIIDDKVCYQQKVFLFASSPAETAIEDGGLFCIYFDNYAERNFYLDPNFVQDPITFDNYINDYANPSIYSKPTYTEPEFTLNSFYKSGDPIYIIYPNEARGQLVLPAPLISDKCVDQNTMAYWKEETKECVREVTNLATQCETLPTLSYSAYALGFKVVTTSGLFGYVENGTLIEITTAPTPATTTPTGNTTGPTTTPGPTQPPNVNPDAVQTLYNNPYTVEIDYTTETHRCIQADGSIIDCVAVNASYSNMICSNVVKEVRYTVTTDGTSGIKQVLVQFVFANITAADLPLTQKFSVNFNSISDSNVTVARSGNPGYQVGKILLYGTLNSTTDPQGVTTQQIIMPTDPTLGLTVVSSTVLDSPATGAPIGLCSQVTATRIPVQFGENIRTGCTMQLNLTALTSQTQSEVCSLIQTRILEALEGPNLPTFDVARRSWPDNNRYVATFGNTGTDQVGDWVKVIVSNRPVPDATQADLPTDTCRLSLGLHIQVLYASVGSLANPQSKILGVALLYDNVRDVKYRCVGSFCQTGNEDLIQNFEVSQSVSFVDASQPAIKVKGEAPVFIARVPNDFFYPFLYYTSSSTTRTAHFSLAVILSSLVIVYFNFKSGLV